MRRRSLQDGDRLVEAAEIAKGRSVLDCELRMPGCVEAEFESALVLGTGLSLESHGVVHAREFERGPAVGGRACRGQVAHRSDAVISIERGEALPEVGDGGFPLFNCWCHSTNSATTRSSWTS